MVSDGKVHEYDDDGRVMGNGGNESTLEEGIQILLTRRENLTTSVEAEWCTTLGGDAGRRPIGGNDRVPQETLGQTSRDMGHVQEAERKVLVADNV